MISISADQAQDGDVLLDPVDGSVYQLANRQDGIPQWKHMDLVGFYGKPWNPEGELILVVRGGHPVEG